jgi:hypothetical protein
MTTWCNEKPVILLDHLVRHRIADSCPSALPEKQCNCEPHLQIRKMDPEANSTSCPKGVESRLLGWIYRGLIDKPVPSNLR